MQKRENIRKHCLCWKLGLDRKKVKDTERKDKETVRKRIERERMKTVRKDRETFDYLVFRKGCLDSKTLNKWR